MWYTSAIDNIYMVTENTIQYNNSTSMYNNLHIKLVRSVLQQWHRSIFKAASGV